MCSLATHGDGEVRKQRHGVSCDISVCIWSLGYGSWRGCRHQTPHSSNSTMSLHHAVLVLVADLDET